MTLEMTDFSQLDSVLEQERAFLLEGDLEGLGSLLPVKEKLVELLLMDVSGNREQITPLEGKLQRNQLLLDGALDGIRAVAARLAALRQVRSALDTYDAQGRKQSVEMPSSPKVEKRA
ncbi:flagellar biosynthesis protein FlgN [uncultured Sulfitobacter sp.]|uniref:flagellar biosynthesis protein FlgN n=1 Tax=uncultured Sulfitobacter sp. TaxID=191468 RepID=UPI0026376B14|nr:flagellar biosynthesis protein FlgN [uncultured Sulfitobacter sp.]